MSSLSSERVKPKTRVERVALNAWTAKAETDSRYNRSLITKHPLFQNRIRGTGVRRRLDCEMTRAILYTSVAGFQQKHTSKEKVLTLFQYLT